jgi:peroxiredoxin
MLLCAASVFASGELSNRRAPGFSLPDSTGKQHDLAEFRGKAVLVDFMQTSCPHCKTFSAILEAAKMKYGEKLVVLSIVNPPSEQKSVAQYITDTKVKSPILFDCGQVAYSYLKPSGTSIAIPHVFLIDAEGMIRNDFSFSDKTKDIFEGKALFPEIDRLLIKK